MDKDEQELELEDEIFEEVAEEEEKETLSDAALLDEDEAEDEFVQGSVDADDLTTDFDATIPTREIDVDEDTQGDEGAETDGVVLLTSSRSMTRPATSFTATKSNSIWKTCWRPVGPSLRRPRATRYFGPGGCL